MGGKITSRLMAVDGSLGKCESGEGNECVPEVCLWRW